MVELVARIRNLRLYHPVHLARPLFARHAAERLRTERFRSPPTRSGSRRGPRIGIDTSQSHRSRTSRRSPVPSAPTTTAVGSVKSISSYRFEASPARPTVQTPALLQLLERARDVDDLRDLHVRHRAGRRLRRRAVERRRVPRLPHDAVGAGRIDGPQDRADVVRILDAVEHDDQRRAGRRLDQIRDVVRVARPRTSRDHALVHAAARSRSSSAVATRRTGTPCALGRVAPDRATRPPARVADAQLAVTRPARSASSTGLMP